MTLTPGTHALTEANGDLLLYTTVEGPAAALGHNLILRAARWRATAVVGDKPEACSLEVVVDMPSLEVYGSKGSAKPVASSDKKVIEANIRKVLGVEGNPTLRFATTSIAGTWEKADAVGTMTLRGRTEAQGFEVGVKEDGTVRLKGTITQTKYGIKPFSTMIGAMRLGDDVTVRVVISL